MRFPKKYSKPVCHELNRSWQMGWRADCASGGTPGTPQADCTNGGNPNTTCVNGGGVSYDPADRRMFGQPV